MRILLVEPYLPLARACQRGLEEEGFLVELAGEEDATRLALTGHFDVILVDLDPPNQRGLRLLQSWRRAALTTPVLLLVLPDSRPDPRDKPDLGIHDTLAKPFSLQELLVRVRTLACRKVSQRPLSPQASCSGEDGEETSSKTQRGALPPK
jgi:DNA-binding response OmpR family regulator